MNVPLEYNAPVSRRQLPSVWTCLLWQPCFNACSVLMSSGWCSQLDTGSAELLRCSVPGWLRQIQLITHHGQHWSRWTVNRDLGVSVYGQPSFDEVTYSQGLRGLLWADTWATSWGLYVNSAMSVVQRVSRRVSNAICHYTAVNCQSISPVDQTPSKCRADRVLCHYAVTRWSSRTELCRVTRVTRVINVEQESRRFFHSNTRYELSW